MNIRTKLILSVGVLAGMIILLVALSVVNLQILTATEPDSPAAVPGLQRALLWISVIGGVCIFASIILLVWLPRSISKPIQELTRGILEIANHNYEKRLDMSGHEEFREVADSFNRMAERLTEYRASTLNDILSAKKFLEAIVNSIDEPIIGLNRNREILFINNEALNVLNLKREEVIHRSAEELSLKNDLLRRLVRELVNPGEKKEPLKIYADNKESYFKASYITIINAEADDDEPHNLGDVILLKNITEFKELDSAKTTFISTISHELKTPISAILMSLHIKGNKRSIVAGCQTCSFTNDASWCFLVAADTCQKSLMTDSHTGNHFILHFLLHTQRYFLQSQFTQLKDILGFEEVIQRHGYFLRFIDFTGFQAGDEFFGSEVDVHHFIRFLQYTVRDTLFDFDAGDALNFFVDAFNVLEMCGLV